MLDPLRVNVEELVPADNPYEYLGTAGSWDQAELQRSFNEAHLIEVGNPDPTRATPPFFGLSAVGSPSAVQSGTSLDIHPIASDVSTLRVVKTGVLNRKDEMLEGGKRAVNRKWRPWSVILTGSQLLFFRDTMWANTLSAQPDSEGRVPFPHGAVFKPDEVIPVKEACAVFDKSYVKVR